jgi:hypothetical protein
MLALPAVFLFGAATWLLIRSRQIGPLEVVIVALFGFFLASSGIAHIIAAVLTALGGATSGTGH